MFLKADQILEFVSFLINILEFHVSSILPIIFPWCITVAAEALHLYGGFHQEGYRSALKTLDKILLWWNLYLCKGLE